HLVPTYRNHRARGRGGLLRVAQACATPSVGRGRAQEKPAQAERSFRNPLKAVDRGARSNISTRCISLQLMPTYGEGHACTRAWGLGFLPAREVLRIEHDGSVLD